MAQNVGKKFEENWKKSVPDNILFYRLHDPPQSFNKGDSGLRFSWKNPCDCFLFNGTTGIFYTLELKSSGNKALSFEKEPKTYKTANIHYHQIEGLTEFSQYPNVISGFIFNFRIEDKELEVTYFQSIQDFNKMIETIGKKSFNIIDLVKHNGIKIEQTKKKVNYTYNIEKFMKDVETK